MMVWVGGSLWLMPFDLLPNLGAIKIQNIFSSYSN
jgi:hypothetical protein